MSLLILITERVSSGVEIISKGKHLCLVTVPTFPTLLFFLVFPSVPPFLTLKARCCIFGQHRMRESHSFTGPAGGLGGTGTVAGGVAGAFGPTGVSGSRRVAELQAAALDVHRMLSVSEWSGRRCSAPTPFVIQGSHKFF